MCDDSTTSRAYRIVRPDGTVVETDDVHFAALAADVPLTSEEVEHLD